MTVNQRTQALRQWMQQESIDIIVVPTMDPHNSEYVAERWKCRQWLTGFTGSAGTAIVTPDDARLWTDSRYWLQATQQLDSTPFTLMREGEDTDLNTWLHAQGKVRIAYVASMMTAELHRDIFNGLQPEMLDTDPFDLLWTTRPPMPLAKVEVMDDTIAGQSAHDKLQRLALWAHNEHSQLFINELSEVCWLLNLRGADIPFNPFPLCFFNFDVKDHHHTLFIDHRQLTDDVKRHLDSLGISTMPYEAGLQAAKAHILDFNPVATPIAAWRAEKNETEQQGFRDAHLRDGIAMVRFLHWLDTQSASQFATAVTEMEVDKVLTAFRAEQPGFRGLSFETIAAYGPHGAIVHYEATPDTDATLQPRSLLLLDSGAHYDCGTTDITRTIALGPLSEEERRVYTLVLKGHLQLANLTFPDGTTGLQLDTAARMAMWREGYDFGHGTGHGVGHRLSVHEGPVQIRKNLRACTTLPFHAGQNITDEPGIYVAGKFGVRIENILSVIPSHTTDYGHFLSFEQLTLCPYDLRPVIIEMLTDDERSWLNDYHTKVRNAIMPHLTDENEKEWLQNATRSI